MNFKTVTYISLISAAAMMSSAAYAEGHGGKGKRGGMQGAQIERMFNQADANSDGVLTRDELRASVAAKFASMDSDANGQISRDEMKAERDAMRNARFAALDSDGNGTLSAGEMTARMQDRMAQRMQRRIERLDTNGDGQISQEEMEAKMQERRGQRGERGKRGERRSEERGERRERRGGEHAKRGERRGGEHGKRGGRRMGGKDRMMTLAGMEAGALRMFDRLDADRDGYVTKFEVSQAGMRRNKR